ncbi:MAG: hypothetical protein FWC73_01290 [Defluviitaleaceae bacterium]|nr:hypothetical protein [Defluviitaleaceae bacterium]
MPIKYMKKYRWVILTLLLVIGILVAVWISTRAHPAEQNFQGIFIQHILEESPSISI